jgi:hypothetical protein
MNFTFSFHFWQMEQACYCIALSLQKSLPCNAKYLKPPFAARHIRQAPFINRYFTTFCIIKHFFTDIFRLF